MSNFTHKVGIEKNSIGSNTLSYDFWFSVPTHESITIGLGFRYIRVSHPNFKMHFLKSTATSSWINKYVFYDT